jgi:hypothetical protein
MRNPLILHVLFFMQLQWLSVLAGISFSYLQDINTTARRQWLMPLYTITPLLFIQALCTALLISQMICGHFINAILQGFGGLTFFTIGAFSYYWLPRKPLLSHIISGGILGGLILFGWQRILSHRYWSVEWCVLFFAPCVFLIVLATFLKVAFWYWGKSKNRMQQKQHRILNLICVGLWYILFTIIASFFSAMAFDCGI